MGAAYEWIGLGIGILCVVLAAAGLVADLSEAPDFGNIGFDLVFGLFWAGVAFGSGYSLTHTRAREVGGGCLVITTITGGLVLLAGVIMLLLTIDNPDPPPGALVGVMLGVGIVLLIPSALMLWHRRNPSPAAAQARRWEGIVAGALIVFVGGVVFVATTGDPYDAGFIGHLAIGAVMVLGAAVIGFSALLLWRDRGRDPTRPG